MRDVAMIRGEPIENVSDADVRLCLAHARMRLDEMRSYDPAIAQNWIDTIVSLEVELISRANGQP